MTTPAIELDHLTKRYGTERGITDLSFTVGPGEVFGFIGPNGAGKSTTIRTLLALVRPSGGSARIFGLDCLTEAPRIAARVGYASSEPTYYEQMRVREFLAYAADLHRVDADARIRELAGRLHLGLDRRISHLSLGNKKKVGLVAALLHSPDLIILDEPTSGLDPLMQQEFFDILREENARGATVFFSSHVLGDVQRICQRVAILREGALVNVQNIAELRRQGYKRVVVRTDVPIPASFVDGLNVADVTTSPEGVTFIHQGPIGILLDRLRNLPLVDLYLEEPDLEEIFLHYYR